MNLPKVQVAVAGSTKHSLMVTQALANDSRFNICWILTPSPKKVGRKQEKVTNPLHQWSIENSVRFELIDKKIEKFDSNIVQPDYLLVVDFGYFIPDWLLDFPKLAPINIHPSALPKWRGSSPGQFAILYGEKQSAVSLIRITSELDAGPVINQVEFSVDENWNSEEYYHNSFMIVRDHIADWIIQYKQNPEQEVSQPIISPTPFARKILKKDAFVSWDLLSNLQNNKQKLTNCDFLEEKSLLRSILQQSPTDLWPKVIARACRAFQPWPLLWTTIPTSKGEKRMQILDCKVSTNNQEKKLALAQVKIEGQKISEWNQVKNAVID